MNEYFPLIPFLDFSLLKTLKESNREVSASKKHNTSTYLVMTAEDRYHK